MSYKVSYDSIPVPDRRGKKGRKKAYSAALAGGILVGLLIAGMHKGVNFDFLLPGDPDVTRSAIGNMVSSLQNDGDISNALTVFCREVIHGAESSH